MTIKPNYKVNNNENQTSILIDLPGVTKKDIKLTSQDDSLKISAQRNQNTPEDWQPINQSTKPNSYELELELNSTLDTPSTTASFENAVLTLTINKQKSSSPREISILN